MKRKHWTVQWLPTRGVLAFWAGMSLQTLLVIWQPQSILGVAWWRPLLGVVLFMTAFFLRAWGDAKDARAASKEGWMQ